MPSRAQCFALMYNSDISGVGVVDRVRGHLVANLSVSDLRCLRSPDDFDLLGMPVIRFAHARWASEQRLAAAEEPPTPGTGTREPQPQQQQQPQQQTQPQRPAGGALRPAVVCVTLESSLLDVMEALVAQRVHRVYVAEGPKPVGVVTITDILRLFAVDPNDDPEGWLTW